jgi:Mlc titration factor MtfA (ptsG expression regulator)
MFGLFKQRRRARLRAAPFPPLWARVLESLPAFKVLPPQDQSELRGHIQVFLDEKVFEGCGGLTMTDDIRVTIAAQACMLLLHRDTDYYPGLTSILVYPAGYVANSRRVGPDGVVTEGPQARLGESWSGVNSRSSGGPVVLSWRDVVAGAADIHDGHNVVFHEFAHQLDAESGAVEGAPALDRRSKYVAWARVLGREYAQLLEDLRLGHEPWLDAYGATNPAEFFAVLTEAFFEQPLKLKTRHPDLYAQLADFYRQDPASIAGAA